MGLISTLAKGYSLKALATLPGLTDVERIIRSKLETEAPVLHQASEYLLALGGKRIRPVLTILCGRLFGMPEDFTSHLPGRQLLDVAAGIELIHMATLLHDDIIDKSPVRRHQQSPWVKFGQDATLLTGDFLLVRAFGLCARLDRFIIDRTESACVALTEGEVLETNLVDQQHSLESSLTVARKKTAALFVLAAETGAHLAGAGSRSTQAMADFGENLGIAFQVLDDILDVTSSEDLLGKRSGQDLKERKPSAINVLWLNSGSKLAQQLRTPTGPNEDAFVEAALQELRGSPVVEQARQLASSFAERASQALSLALAENKSGKSDPKAEELLRALMAYILERLN